MTFFAAMAPFIAMSFLLGGIDFVTILSRSLRGDADHRAEGLHDLPEPAGRAGDPGLRRPGRRAGEDHDVTLLGIAEVVDDLVGQDPVAAARWRRAASVSIEPDGT